MEAAILKFGAHVGFQFDLLFGDAAEFRREPGSLSTARSLGQELRALRTSPERDWIGSVVGVEAEAHAERDGNFEALNHQRRGKALLKVVGGLLSDDRIPDAGEHDSEFLAAGARNDVHGAHLGGEDGCDALNAFVADSHTEGVVDALEAVDVEADDGELLIVSGGVVNGRREQLGEEHAVGEPSEVVILRLVLKPLRQGLALGDVNSHDKAARAAVEDDVVGREIERNNRTVLADVTRCPVGPGLG